jgi:hypothetical protein
LPGCAHLAAQVVGFAKTLGKAVDRDTGCIHQSLDLGGALRIVDFGRFATLLDLGQTMMQGIDQRVPTITIVEQVVFQIRIPLHDPDVTQHLVQHAGRTPGDALGTRSSSSTAQLSAPSRRMTISRSENEV